MATSGSVPYYAYPAPKWICVEDRDGRSWEGDELKGCVSKPRTQTGLANFYQLRGLVHELEVAEILDVACQVLADSVDGGSSLWKDSVDEWPTFEFYFIQSGRYHTSLQHVLRPLIETRLLPYVREKYQCPGAHLCHCLFRRYAPQERRMHAVHFDHQAYVTAVLGLNPGDYEGGLFVVGSASPAGNVDSEDAAHLDRHFVPLGRGDVVFHQYDLQHGVQVLSGTRYSLIFWLTDSYEGCVQNTCLWYKRGAEAGDSDSQFNWGRCLLEGSGSGCGVDVASALYWYHKAMEQDNAQALNAFAKLCWDGEVIPADPGWAIALWQRACDLNYAKAQSNLGGLLLSGAGGRAPHSVVEGVRLLRLAAHQGENDAALKLFAHLRHARDPEALKWLLLVANRGHPEACLLAAEVHWYAELGISVPDMGQVVHYTAWAARLGLPRAIANLGTLYAEGQGGLPTDACKAAKLWRKAKDSGDASALTNLAVCHYRGIGGCVQDMRTAFQFCKAAAEQAHPAALQLLYELHKAVAAEEEGTNDVNDLQLASENTPNCTEAKCTQVFEIVD